MLPKMPIIRKVFAPDEVFIERMEKCSNCCDFIHKTRRCNVCKCYMLIKSGLKFSKCPKGVWDD